MQRATAIKTLRRILGRDFGYQVDPSAPTAEERHEARQELIELAKKREQLSEATKERREALLAADSKYQELLAEWREIRKKCDERNSKSHHYKISVGTSDSMFFRIAAQGDSWEDVIGKVRASK